MSPCKVVSTAYAPRLLLLTEPSPARPLEANLARPGRSQQELTPGGGGSEEWGLLFYKTQTFATEGN